MSNLKDLIPDETTLLELEPAFLAGYIIEGFNSLEPRGRVLIDINGYAQTQASLYGKLNWVPRARAIMEAWQWLEREGFVALEPFSNTNKQGMPLYFITRRGAQLRSRSDLETAAKASLLPKKILHPTIAQRVFSAFVIGDYDTAVFQAFKEVEVAVRIAIEAEAVTVGTDLMRTAFHAKTGRLTNQDHPMAEREALAHLFAGAIGSYKNPVSHRHVSISAEEAVEMILLASHLLNIVDSRSTQPRREPGES